MAESILCTLSEYTLLMNTIYLLHSSQVDERTVFMKNTVYVSLYLRDSLDGSLYLRDPLDVILYLRDSLDVSLYLRNPHDGS